VGLLFDSAVVRDVLLLPATIASAGEAYGVAWIRVALRLYHVGEPVGFAAIPNLFIDRGVAEKKNKRAVDFA
jgi:hypothetical protein